MFDFLVISSKPTRNGFEIFPKFRLYPKSKDLMIRGGDFYAIWLEDKGVWSTDEGEALDAIDRELDKYVKENKSSFDGMSVKVKHMWDSDSGMIDKWHKFCQKQSRDSFTPLDEKLVFSNTPINKEDYSSKHLKYALEYCDISSYDMLMSTLYSTEERHKIEWAIGSIITGDSKHIQKFLVLYGPPKTGKSTILNIIQMLFDGYYSVFDAKALGSSGSQFALEAFKTNPLVAIQHDGDLSRIEDNTRLNSLVSHELMMVNEKYKSSYPSSFKAFLFLGTNKPVKITDSKSGLLRRLIDVTPTGDKVPRIEYEAAMKRIPFELGGIACHCKDVYLSNPGYYDDYSPLHMMGATNDFYNFIIDSYHMFKRDDGVTEKVAWSMYQQFCEESKVQYPASRRVFREELKNYFREYTDTLNLEDGTKVKFYYKGFRSDIFETKKSPVEKIEKTIYSWIELAEQKSILDDEYSNCYAQYASKNETPSMEWDKVVTTLSDIDTKKCHYLRVPENHIVIDFDIKDENGNKSLELNMKAASNFPPTYTEVSKGGNGLHLHYIYTGDVEELSRLYDDNIEIKVFTGKSSLRRKLSLCTNDPIAKISSGLPLREVKKVIDFTAFKNEKAIRTIIAKSLRKEYAPHSTKCSIDFIKKTLDDAYTSGMTYDVSDMKNDIIAFAAESTNNSDYCLKVVSQLHFTSDSPSDPIKSDKEELVFYDVEVFPNLLIVCFKARGEGKPVVRLINPKPEDIEDLLKFNLIGFNCRRYDNHILWAALLGWSNERIYNLSQKIINSKKGENRECFFGEAYNLSYTDIYDFASAGNKKSLKKLEIEMGIHHQELGMKWDEPVPKEKWELVAQYCDNDVIATEAAFDYLKADWIARQILADLAGMTVNDTTNTLTTKIIFGNNKKPQNEFNYRNLAKPVFELDEETREFLKEACPDMMEVRHGKSGSLLPYFEGYVYKNGISTYKGIKVGEGGLVIAKPGIYENVALLDIASMHPHSAIAECLFGVRYTRAFRDIVEGRVSIKHKAWAELDNMLDGKLKPYIARVEAGEFTAKDLANALKTAINSVYGLTKANFDCAFRDVRNVDNIVAKRGALFMIDLYEEVTKRGFTVAHIKTDSIKIPNATPDIIEFVMDFAKKYGYTFEHEATYDRMCLVNDAVYIARYKSPEACQEMYGYIPGDNYDHGRQWTATGKQFQIPYVFKTLFSKEQIVFEDLCETFSVKSALYLDINEKLPDVTLVEHELEKLEAKYKNGRISQDIYDSESARLMDIIETGHDYHFVGKVCQFCPVKPGTGGGILKREQDGKYYAAAGTTGYRWIESELLRDTNRHDIIDRTYYRKLVDDAIESISEYGDFDLFVSEEESDIMPVMTGTFDMPENIEDEVLFA